MLFAVERYWENDGSGSGSAPELCYSALCLAGVQQAELPQIHTVCAAHKQPLEPLQAHGIRIEHQIGRLCAGSGGEGRHEIFSSALPEGGTQRGAALPALSRRYAV